MNDLRLPSGRWSFPRRLHTIAVLLFAAAGIVHIVISAGVLVPLPVLLVPPVLVLVVMYFVPRPRDLTERINAAGGNQLLWHGWTGRVLVLYLVVTVILSHGGNGPSGSVSLVDGHPVLVAKGGNIIRALTEGEYHAAMVWHRRVESIVALLVIWVLTRTMELTISLGADPGAPAAP